MTACVKGFGCRPLERRRRVFGGRRPKASKGGNRALGNVRPCRGRYGDLSAAGELADMDRADPAGCAAMMRFVNGRRIASHMMNCRTIRDDGRVFERGLTWPVGSQRARRADLRDCDAVMRCRS